MDLKLLASVLFLSSVAIACPKGTVEFSGGCAAMPSPADQSAAPVIASSSEKPSQHPEAAWERGEVKAAMPLPETAESENNKRVAYDAKAEKAQK